MTKGVAKQLEADVVIFPIDTGRDDQETILLKTDVESDSTEQKSVKNSLEVRYARLKKSLRKRSVSIL